MDSFDRYSYNFSDLFDAVNTFSNQKISFRKLSDLLEFGLQTILQFQEANFAAFYQLNKEAFDFEYQLSYPGSSNYEIEKIHETLIDNGIIGKAVASGKISFYPLDENTVIYVLPLVTYGGPLGLIELYCSNVGKSPELASLQMASLFSSLFAGSINEYLLKESERKTKDTIDQLVASRTINIAKSKQELGDKIESMKSNLSMSIPHEVRTPINQILGFSDYLLQTFKSMENVEDDVIEILTDIRSSAVRLRRLFENYLYYAKLTLLATDIHEIRALVNYTTFYAESVILETVMLKSSNSERNSDVKINLVEGSIRMGEEFITKIVEELLDNSIKYSEPGTGIHVSSYIDSGNYVLSFKDHGRGMNSEQINKIDAYVQFERGQYEQQGSGLGLSIVRKILDLHGGDLTIKSVEGEYADVTAWMPISTVDCEF